MERRLATKLQRAVLLAKQECKCAICGNELDGKYEADHRREWASGGSTELRNLQILCLPCHKIKTRLYLARGSKI